MKLRILALLLAVFLLFLSGCKSTGNVSSAKQETTGEGYYDSNTQDEAKQKEPEQTIRKIIKNGSLDLETNDVDKTYANILSHATENGGYEFSHQKTDRDDYISIDAVIKIKPEKLDALISYAGSVAVVINSSTSSEDITDQYYDAQLRLETKKKTLESYYELLKNTKELDAILTIQSEINKITEDIEALEGKLKLWNQLVGESTLTITINQANDPLKPKKEVNWSALSWGDMGLIIKNGFTTVSNIIVTIVQWTFIIIVSISPLIIIAGIVFLILRTMKKKKRKKQGISSKSEESKDTTENK